MNYNERLADERGLSKADRKMLTSLYAKLAHILEYPEDYDDPVGAVYDIEVALQEVWGFGVDHLRHTHWNKIKGCTCPQVDNDERFGQEKIMSGSCPWHGDIVRRKLNNPQVADHTTVSGSVVGGRTMPVCPECGEAMWVDGWVDEEGEVYDYYWNCTCVGDGLKELYERGLE